MYRDSKLVFLDRLELKLPVDFFLVWNWTVADARFGVLAGVLDDVVDCVLFLLLLTGV